MLDGLSGVLCMYCTFALHSVGGGSPSAYLLSEGSSIIIVIRFVFVFCFLIIVLCGNGMCVCSGFGVVVIFFTFEGLSSDSVVRGNVFLWRGGREGRISL